MRTFISLAALAAAFITTPVLAEDAPDNQAVRIETDQAAKAFIFIIDDEPVAMLDKEGLHVVENIEYGRSLIDTGPQWVKDKIASGAKEAADD